MIQIIKQGLCAMQGYVLCCALCLLLQNAHTQTFTFDFETDAQGWKADWADYPVTDSIFYELESKHTNLPNYILPNQKGIYIQGFNRSDDLFMFLKKKLTGLLPNQRYILQFQLEMASDAPTNAVGVGGSPGLTIKVGAVSFEPIKVIELVGGTRFYVMNMDKGNQSTPGSQMDTIGKTSVSDTTTQFTLINRQNKKAFIASTNSNGELWAIVGTESAFEGFSALYYSKIVLTLTATTAIEKTPTKLDSPIYPNPVTTTVFLDTTEAFDTYSLYDMIGRLVKNAPLSKNALDVSFLPQGVYVLILKQTNGVMKYSKFIKVQ
jgi:Secretion system C-terminal sorting domain